MDPNILRKIKKCLALGASPNPNEAAAAMRQAHALMRQHGVEAHHVAMAEVGEARVDVRTMARDKPAHWEANLAATVGKAFGCQLLISTSKLPKEYRRHLNEGEFIFVGQKAQAEIAAYTASVLARKCKASRSKWISENLSEITSLRGGKAKATRMGDAFAEGWVQAIGTLVADFANPQDIEDAITKHIEQRSSGNEAQTRSLKDKKIGIEEAMAASMGAKAAKGESLYRPMHANAPQTAIGFAPQEA